MKDIQIYYGDCLQQELIWNKETNKYDVITHVESNMINPIRFKKALTEQEAKVTLRQRIAPSARNDYSLVFYAEGIKQYDFKDLISKQHLINNMNATWIKFKDDNTTWEEIASRYKFSTERNYRELLNQANLNFKMEDIDV